MTGLTSFAIMFKAVSSELVNVLGPALLLPPAVDDMVDIFLLSTQQKCFDIQFYTGYVSSRDH